MNKFKSIEDLTKYVLNINYGYISKKNGLQKNKYSNPDDDYKLQTPQELTLSNYGLCYDIVEFYRNYLFKLNLTYRSYYIQYKKNEDFESHSFIIYRKNGKWYECLDNMWENEIIQTGFYTSDALIRNIYTWFIDFVQSRYQDVSSSFFYLTKYKKPFEVYENKKSLIDFCYQEEAETVRNEHSSMAIVLFENKVLVLETKSNEIIFPKGHIEANETSKDAAMRECFEESGIDLTDAIYHGYLDDFFYSFQAGDLKMINIDFLKKYKVSKINKKISVHFFEIEKKQKIVLEPIFRNGYFLDIKEAYNLLNHQNSKEMLEKALRKLKRNI